MFTSNFYLIILCLCLALVGCSGQQTDKAAKAEKQGTSAENIEKPFARAVKIVELPNIPSASGMVVYDDVIYIVGDDSPFLYRLDLQYRQLRPIRLFDTTDFATGRIPKSLKPDLEAMTLLTINAKQYLFAAGSGSAATRDKGFLVDLKSHEVTEISLLGFYNELRSRPEIVNGLELNIEGITATKEAVYLLQRGVGERINTVIKLSADDFLKVLNTGSTSGITISTAELVKPEINNVKGGFSGLTFMDDRFFVTASVENTLDPVLDGEVLGSFAGVLDAHRNKVKLALITGPNGEVLPVKVESIAIIGRQGKVYKALAVTDNDQGGSELLELEISVD